MVTHCNPHILTQHDGYLDYSALRGCFDSNEIEKHADAVDVFVNP